MRCPRHPLVPTLSILACALALPIAHGAETEHDQRTAEEPTPIGETIVVTGERRETTIARSTSDIDVVDADELRMRGHPSSPWQWLQGLAGVDAAGGAGGIDGGIPRIKLRGANSYDTLIQLDGIPLEDPSTTQGQPNLAHLFPAGLDRVEVVRGAQSGVYGSRAVGGVVNFQTIRPTRAPHEHLRAEVGAYGTADAEASATGPISSTVGFALSAAGLGSNGFSATTDANAHGDARNHESDSVHRGGVTGRVEWKPKAGSMAYLAVNTVALNQEFDDGFGGGPDDPLSYTTVKSYRTSAGGETKLSDKLTIGTDLAYTATDRIYNAATFNATYYGKQEYVGAHARYRLTPELEFAGGVDGRRHDLDIKSGGYSHSQDWLGGGWGQVASSSDWHELVGSVREDLHSRSGDATTWRLAGAAFMAQDCVKPHASVGTGFRAPSLYEQNDPFVGNPDLAAQRSISYDAGVSFMPIQDVVHDCVILDVTAFRTDYRTLIDFVPTGPFTGQYMNIHDYSVEGVESSLRVADPQSPIFARFSYTWQMARETPAQTGGTYSAYLPRHHIGVVLGVREDKYGWLSINGERVSRMNAGFGGTTYLPWYTVVGASAGAFVGRDWELYVRVENLLDEHYETNPGNTNSGQAFYFGADAHF